ncbi:hypothetical protein Hdeb2414_s0086g00784471 [Helianthus debilis subsp. tardiflorus]
MIAKDIGFEFEDGEYMRLIYAMYLDVLVYYYKIKITQETALEMKEEKVEDPRECKSDGEKEIAECSSDVRVTENDISHYALYAGDADWSQGGSGNIHGEANDQYVHYGGSDWQGLKKLQRKRFDFSRAEKAVTEANKSVLKNSRKQNYV